MTGSSDVDVNMERPRLTTEDLQKIERLSRHEEALKKAPLVTHALLNDLFEGHITLSSQSERVECSSGSALTSEEMVTTMK